jgi:putative GTP pyrophosphokinase
MENKLSISQLNKLGERLRKRQSSHDDLRALETFRLSFAPAAEQVSRVLTDLGLNPVSRPAKSTDSIIAKLNRERSRLSKIQDIAGSRIEVDNTAEQDRAVKDILGKFPDAVVQDRRLKPSHGYRAVHLIVVIDEHLVELQVRTCLQHGWASAVERLADTIDAEIKYGGGPDRLQAVLVKSSNSIAGFEKLELHHQTTPVPDDEKSRMLQLKSDLQELLRNITIVAQMAEKL